MRRSLIAGLVLALSLTGSVVAAPAAPPSTNQVTSDGACGAGAVHFTLYTDVGYGGTAYHRCWSYGQGDSTLTDDVWFCGGIFGEECYSLNDRFSSIIITVPFGRYLAVYRDANYGGTADYLNGSSSNLHALGCGDSISSLRVV